MPDEQQGPTQVLRAANITELMTTDLCGLVYFLIDPFFRAGENAVKSANEERQKRYRLRQNRYHARIARTAKMVDGIGPYLMKTEEVANINPYPNTSD